MKMIKKILYYFGILIYSVAICSTTYSQNSTIHKNYKKISWKKITNEKKPGKHLKDMTDQYKYVYIRTLEQNDSFKILVTNKFSPLNEIKGGYNDFKYLEEHMMTPLFNYAVSVNYYEYKFVYILLNGRKEKLKFKLRKNRNFVYIIEYEDGWHLTYSNNSWW